MGAAAACPRGGRAESVLVTEESRAGSPLRSSAQGTWACAARDARRSPRA